MVLLSAMRDLEVELGEFDMVATQYYRFRLDANEGIAPCPRSLQE
jgi:hypothetical protein